MNRRRLPSPAAASSALPSLASLLAAGLAVEGCAHVECGDARADEVRRHGPEGTAALRRGELRAGLREVAIAAGLVAHPPTRVEPRSVPGGERVVSPTEPVSAPGQMLAVTPQAPDPPAEPHPTRDPFERPREVMPMGGAPPRVSPDPPPPPRPPPPPAHPRRREMPLGDMKSVGPEPK